MSGTIIGSRTSALCLNALITRIHYKSAVLYFQFSVYLVHMRVNSPGRNPEINLFFQYLCFKYGIVSHQLNKVNHFCGKHLVCHISVSLKTNRFDTQSHGPRYSALKSGMPISPRKALILALRSKGKPPESLCLTVPTLFRCQMDWWPVNTSRDRERRGLE